MKNNHYLYYHFNPQTRKLFYVGVGKKGRAYAFKWGRSKYFYNYIKKYGNPIVIIRYKNLNEDEAYSLEEKLIKKLGRIGIEENGVLVNRSSGGKTSAGGVKQSRTQEWNNNISKAKKGKPQHTQEGKNLIGEKNSESIIQKDLNNNIIKEFKSIKLASEYTKIPKQKIDGALQNPLNNTTGFLWEYKNRKRKSRNGKKVQTFDENWNFIKEYSSINEAERDLEVTGIRQFLSGRSYYIGENKYKFKLCQ